MSDLDRRMAGTFAAQLSLVTRRQVLAAGGSDSLIRRRLSAGRWETAEFGVYGLAGVAWTWRRNLAAVVLSMTGAMASHRSAATLLGAVHDDRATPPLRLAVDLGSVVAFDAYRRAVGILRRRHGVDWLSLDRVYRQHSVQGRNGCGALRNLLERHFGAHGAPDEVVEIRCADLLVAAGLPAPEHQFTVDLHRKALWIQCDFPGVRGRRW